ncbi:hypothetical protein SLS60_010123 [Paraconiothyrium brasiliense]|uniref:Rhodopsin domain-containing protein n=1 Tax=Paraconiothyrium brasiliense TaxID=300254 RepID=A0ABR3QQT1_9PLEO
MDLNKPIVPPPTGYVVDLENPQRRGEAVITWVGIVGMVIATTLLLIRVYTKLVVVKKLASDDLLYSPALAFAKMSFLCFYLNVNPDQTFRIGVFITMFVVIGSCVGVVVSLLAACSPFAKNTDVTVTGGECINKASLYIATGVLNIVTDIMVLILPIPMVLGLQMVRSRKIMLILLFSVGSM